MARLDGHTPVKTLYYLCIVFTLTDYCDVSNLVNRVGIGVLSCAAVDSSEKKVFGPSKESH